MRNLVALRLRRMLSVAVAASIGLIPAVMVATPAQAAAGDITVDADLEQVEGDTFVFELRREGGGLQPVTLKYDTVAGVAPAADVTGGLTSDLTRLSGTTTFNASPTTSVKRFSVVTKDDALNEESENFVLEFRDNVSNALLYEAHGIIADNDPLPQYSLAVTNPTTEGASAVVTAELDYVSGLQVSIPYTTTPGTALATDDYSAAGGTIIIPAGTKSVTANIATVDDQLDEDDIQTFTVEGGEPTNAVKKIGFTSPVVNIADNDALPVVSISSPPNVTEGEDLVFPVTINAPSERVVTVLVTGSDGTAMGGADFDAYPATLATIGAGLTDTIATVPTLPDSFDEVDPETFSMTLSATPTNATRSLGAYEATGYIDDDNDAPVATLTPTSATEGSAGAVNQAFKVNLGAPSGQEVKISYTVTNGSATVDQDFSAVPDGDLIFAPGDVEKTINVPIIGDLVYEGAETFNINLSNVGGTVGAGSTLGQNSITINEDDPLPTLLAVDSVVRAEDAAGTADFDIKVSNPSKNSIDVIVSTEDGTASSAPGTGRDYDPLSTLVTIPALADHMIVPITVLADTIFEANEVAKLKVALYFLETDATGTSPDATLTINNDDAAPTVVLSQDTAVEGTQITLTATVTGVAQDDIPVHVDLIGGGLGLDAADVGDFLPTSLDATIPGGDNGSTPVPLGLITFENDTIDENDESLLVTLTDPAGDIATATKLQTITDAPDDLPPSFVIDDQSYDEGDGIVTVPIRRVYDPAVTTAQSTERPMAVSYATADGTAKDPADYDGTTGTVNFAPADGAKTFLLEIEDDNVFEVLETLGVTLSSPTPTPEAAISDGTAEITINDDDSGNKPGFTVNAAASPVAEAAGTTNVTINVSPSNAQDIDFVISADNTATATAGQGGPGGDDYSVPTTAKVLAGVGSVTVPVTINPDTVYEGVETVSITVALAALEDDAVGADKTASFTITDDDAKPTLTLNATGNIEGQSVAVTGTITGVAQRAVPILVTAAGALNGAGTYAAGVNDVNTTNLNVIEIPAGDQTGTPVPLGSIALANDQIDEYVENVRITASVDGGPPVLANFDIADDTLDMTPTIAVANAPVSEAGPQANVMASLDFTAPFQNATSTDKVVGAHWATADNTAKSAEDYTASSGDISFNGGNALTTIAIDVPITDDQLFELTEDFYVNLTAPIGTTLTNNQATVSITDNDGSNKPGITVTGPATNAEDAGTVEYTVTLSKQNTQAVDLTVALGGGTATQGVSTPGGDDYAVPTGTLTIPAYQTSAKVNVTIKDDDVYEPSETATLTVAPALGEDDVSGPAVDKTLTITDNDPIPTVVLVAESGAEGTDVVVSAKVTGRSQTDTNFTLSLQGDDSGTNDAAEPGDFVDSHETTKIPVGTVDGAVLAFRTFRLNNDTFDEAVETVKVVATNSANSVASAPQFYRINDDPYDVPPSVSVQDFSVNEAVGTALVPVTLAFPAGTDTTATEQTLVVSLTTGDGTAASPSDFTPKTAPLTFAPGVMASTFNVTIIDDLRNETDETFTVTALSATPAGTSFDSTAGVVTIIDNDQAVVRPTFSIASVPQAEGNVAGTAPVTVTLSGVAADDVSFTVGATDGTAVDTGTGVGSNDYNPPALSTLTIAQGLTTGTIQVPINGDTVYEQDEDVDVAVALTADERDATGGQVQTTLTLSNDDAVPSVVLTAGSGFEGDQIALQGTVSGSTQDTVDASVTFVNEGAEDEDYSLGDVDLTDAIPAGAVTSTPVSLGVLELNTDTIDEPNEVVTAVSGGKTVNYTIRDDPDNLPPTVAIADENIGEAEASVGLTVSLNFNDTTTSTGYDVEVPWSTANDTALTPYDYTGKANQHVTIAAGETSAGIDVPVINDAVSENNQTFFVRLGAPLPSSVKLGDGTAKVTIQDNDEKVTTLVAPTARAGEGAIGLSGYVQESASVVIYAAPLRTPTTYKAIATIKANVTGFYGVTVSVTMGTRYYAMSNGLRSAIKLVQVSQLPRITAAVGSKGVVQLTVTGNPNEAGQAVQFQQFIGGTWKTVVLGRTGTLGTSIAGIKNLRTGTAYTFRAIMPATPDLGILGGTSAQIRAIPK